MTHTHLLPVCVCMMLGLATAQYSIKWTRPNVGMGNFAGVGNTDGDSAKELLFASEGIYLIDGATGAVDLILAINTGSAVLVDADDDGRDEILVGTMLGDTIKLYDWGSGVSEGRNPAGSYREVHLEQSHPNPASSGTTIHYSLAKQSRTSLKVFNTAGQLVRSLVDANMPPGRFDVEWDGNDSRGSRTPAGTYFYELVVDGSRQVRQMVTVE